MESFESQAELVAGSSENSNAAISRTVLPMVAIVGRPNVGKSSLFNRFLKKRVAVVDDEPGVTRDRNYAVCDWNGREFYLIDTGGMVPDSRKGYDAAIMTQAQIAVDEADVILFVVDAQTLPETVDDKIARLLQSTKKPVIVVANKADNPEMEIEAQKFQALGLGEVQPTSATGSRNIGDLLDTVVSSLPEQKTVSYDDAAIRIAVIGRPNVGKSSLVNAILGTERNIVSDIAGTTRDSIDSPLTHNGQKYVLIDTAGLRRKHKVTEDLEFYTNLRALKSLETCDVALIVFDVSEGITSQDMRIIEQAASARRGLVLVANKWDLPEKDSKTADKLTVDYREQLGDLDFIPLVFVSAVEGKRALKPLELAAEVYTRACKRYGTPELNEFLEEAIARQHPPSARGKEIKINYLAQPETNPPTFIFFCNRPEDVAMSYIRYLHNRLREKFDLLGVPFRVKFKKK